MPGIIAAVLASVAFTFNDAGMKLLSGDYPLHELVFIRAAIALTLTLAIIMPLEGGFSNIRTQFLGLHIIRGLCVVMANMTFFLGLASIPLSEATAIFFVSPLVLTAFSVLFLSERVGPRRWAAVLAGLAGAVIMLRPGSASFQAAALFPLAAAFGYAGLHTLTRKIGKSDSASTMAFYVHISMITVSAAIGLAFGDGRFAGTDVPSLEFLFRAWRWPPTEDALLIGAIGCASAAGGYLISRAYRVSPAAVIAPFEYVALVLAIIWGATLFGEWPDAVAWLGMALILGGGLFVLWRESVVNRQLVSKRPMPRNR
ncbi:MAG: DMT family transporter [Pseudomonadota bacterium]